MTKNKRIFIRVTEEEHSQIKLYAVENKLTISDYLREQCFHRKSLGDNFNAEFINRIIQLRGEIGKTTGMLKQAIQSDKYNPASFNKLLKNYASLKLETEKLLNEAIAFLKRK